MMNTNENTAFEDVGGILDIVGNRAFLRLDGYLPGPDDVQVTTQQVRDNDLRRGDTVTGKASAASKLTQVDSVNGQRPGYRRPHFTDLTPLYPNERLRLET